MGSADALTLRISPPGTRHHRAPPATCGAIRGSQTVDGVDVRPHPDPRFQATTPAEPTAARGRLDWYYRTYRGDACEPRDADVSPHAMRVWRARAGFEARIPGARRHADVQSNIRSYNGGTTC